MSFFFYFLRCCKCFDPVKDYVKCTKLRDSPHWKDSTKWAEQLSARIFTYSVHVRGRGSDPRCSIKKSVKFIKIHRKTPVSESPFQ